MKRRILLLVLASFLLPVSAATAGEAIWGGLVLATNVENPKPPPPELADFQKRLQRIFGYNQLELLGSQSRAINGSDEQWLIPSKELFLKIDATRGKRQGYLLNLTLFQGTRLLVESRAELGRGSPLFIRGPLCGRGQLIIVLKVK